MGSILVRQDNLAKTWNMFLQKPFGYGLGTAGPASQIHGGSDILEFREASADFLPENWYLQILIEQGIFGFLCFIIILLLIGKQMWSRVRIQKDPYSIALFTAFVILLFMGCFTHVFEEAATSYVVFLLIGIYLSHNHSL